MPHAIFAKHAAAMLRGPLGVPVVWGSVRTRGMWSEDGGYADTDGGPVPQTERVVMVVTGSITPSQNDALTIDGAAYVVRSPALALEDGGLVRYRVAPVTT